MDRIDETRLVLSEVETQKYNAYFYLHITLKFLFFIAITS